MNIVHAIWEKRNLGLDAWEVSLGEQDAADISATLAALRDSKYAGAYVCVKLPVGCIKLLHALEDEGFRFMETQLHLKDSFKPDDVKKSLTAAGICVESVEVPKTVAHWREVIERITPGMFETDRIAMDPLFGPEVACVRYKNWCMDLFSDERSRLMVYTAGGHEVAFNLQLYDERRKYNKGLLGGVFSPYKDSGFGAAIVLDEEGRNRYGSRKTSVSSNNPAVVKLHQVCGRIIYGMSYVLRKKYDK